LCPLLLLSTLGPKGLNRMAKLQLSNKRALITGASSGIGASLAYGMAYEGARVVLFARRADRLAELTAEIEKFGGEVTCVVGDVTDADDRRRALETARNEFGGLDILVNNAGIAAHGRFIEADPGRLRPIMEVNFFAPIEFIREAVPLLLEGNQPLVVNIGSILGERAAPHKSEYSASKFALHGFTEAIRPELARLGIDVLLVAPGPTESEHFDKLLEDKGLPWPEPRRMSAGKVAVQIIEAMKSRRHKVVTGWRGKALLLLSRVAPRLIDRITSRYG
jgi:short-subunit dehydrogenase